MATLLRDIALETWLITARMAPYLLLGFAVAGLLSAFISPAWLERHLGGRGRGPIFRAALLGIPLPLCSCGVLPVGASLRTHGASRGATTAFLLSTPQTGVDSILATWTLLGPFFALFRPVAALVTGLIGGEAVQALEPDEHRLTPTGGEDERPGNWGARLKAALEYGLITLPGDIGRALALGLILAGILGALVPAASLERFLGGGPLAILAAMAVGIPLYVCATGSIPIAVSFIHMGASPGAALAFLIAGPATNAAALTTVNRILGRRSTVAYLATVAVSAAGCGLALDWLLPRASLAIPFLGGVPAMDPAVGWPAHLAGVILLALMAVGQWSRGRKTDCCGGACAADNDPAMVVRLQINGMRCSHCSDSVDQVLREAPGVIACEVDLKGGEAQVRGTSLDGEDLASRVTALGYEASVL